MKVVVAGGGVARIADVGDGLALSREVAFCESVRVVVQMRVVINGPVIRAELVDGNAAGLAEK